MDFVAALRATHLLVGEVDWVKVGSIGGLIVTLIGAAIAGANQRRTGLGAAAKDIADAGVVARGGLVDELLRSREDGAKKDVEIARLGGIVDERGAELRRLRDVATMERTSHDEQVRAQRAATDLERHRRLLVEEGYERERARSEQLAGLLREAGIPVPERRPG